MQRFLVWTTHLIFVVVAASYSVVSKGCEQGGCNVLSHRCKWPPLRIHDFGWHAFAGSHEFTLAAFEPKHVGPEYGWNPSPSTLNPFS